MTEGSRGPIQGNVDRMMLTADVLSRLAVLIREEPTAMARAAELAAEVFALWARRNE